MRTEPMETSAACETELLDEGRILVVTLQGGPNNLVRPQTLQSLARAIEWLESGNGPELAILRGEGSVFSKGFDVAVIRDHTDPARHRRMLLQCNDACSRLARCSRPVIAAIEGACLGAGLELALACHFRLCAERSRLGLPELSHGLLPGLGGIHRLVRLVGAARALEVLAVGRLLSAEEALAWGLVHRVSPRGEFMDSVLSFARAILSVDQRLVAEAIRLTSLAEVRGDENCVVETIESIVRATSPASQIGEADAARIAASP